MGGFSDGATAPRRQEKWTPSEDAILTEAWRSGVKVIDIAQRLARGRHSVVSRAYRIGLPTKVRVTRRRRDYIVDRELRNLARRKTQDALHTDDSEHKLWLRKCRLENEAFALQMKMEMRLRFLQEGKTGNPWGEDVAANAAGSYR